MRRLASPFAPRPTIPIRAGGAPVRRRAPAATALLAASVVAAACSPHGGVPAVDLAAFPQPLPVPRVVEGKLVDGLGAPLTLRGIAFTNRVWQDDPLPDEHHAEVDFQRVAELGLNSVRFYVHQRTLEDGLEPGQYRAEGFAWLDRNLAWARARGVYLVLGLYVPPHGYPSIGDGAALWSDVDIQRRFVELWRAIAARYRGEPAIAGYHLLSGPVPPDDLGRWRDLAERVIGGIRTVDPGHAIFVERLGSVDGARDPDGEPPLVSDPNVVYSFPFYEPVPFTHQGAPWVDSVATDQRYPDPTKLGVRSVHLEPAASTDASPKLPVGDSDWAFYEGAPYRVEEPTVAVGGVALVASDNTGKAYFDDLVIEELDPEGEVTRQIARIDLDRKAGWHFYTKDRSGQRTEEPAGHGDDGSLAIGGTRSLATASAEIWRFAVRPGAAYRASGWMKGEGIPDGATCQIRLELFRSKVPVLPRDRAFLTRELDAQVAFGREHGVPLYLGEFGAIRGSFDHDRGGERWVADLLDLAAERELHFAYHEYHEDSFGLYAGEELLPSPFAVNAALQGLFEERFALPAAPAAPVASP